MPFHLLKIEIRNLVDIKSTAYFILLLIVYMEGNDIMHVIIMRQHI